MQNVYKCVYDYDDQRIDRLTKNGSSILGLFKVIVENERFVLMPVNHLKMLKIGAFILMRLKK